MKLVVGLSSSEGDKESVLLDDTMEVPIGLPISKGSYWFGKGDGTKAIFRMQWLYPMFILKTIIQQAYFHRYTCEAVTT